MANKYAYLVGREENFGNPGFEATLTPLTKAVKRNANSPETPRPKRRRKQKSTKKIAEKRNANFSPEFSNPNQPKINSPLFKKQRRATFKNNDTFTKFALICEFCGLDISRQKDHLLRHCKGIKSNINNVTSRKSKNAISRCHDIGAAIDSKD